MMDKAARAALLTAKGMDKTSENVADYVADLLRQGRAKEITDDLMEQADPQRLHHHYTSGNTGMDLPMDQASRMARAKQMGFGNTKWNHATALDDDEIHQFKGDNVWLSEANKRGVSHSNDFAKMKAGNTRSPSIFPVYVRGPENRKDWEQHVKDVAEDVGADPEGMQWNEAQHFVFGDSPSEVQAPKSGVDVYEDYPDMDQGRHVINSGIAHPTNIRSQFARFDPRLDHLAHLSASTGGAMDFARHVEAVTRAGGQIAPSKYLPNVPRQVHADGGRENGRAAFLSGNHPDVPNVVYHGTTWDVKSFDRSKIGRSALGFHFGSKFHADDFGSDEDDGPGGNVMPVHLSLKNPIRLQDYGDWLPENLVHHLSSRGKISQDEANNLSDRYFDDNNSEKSNQHFIGVLKRLGHDGIVYLNRHEGLNPDNAANLYYMNADMSDPEFKKAAPEASDSFIAFHPQQIKSATGNQGTFDPNDPDITKADGGEVDDDGITAYHGSPHDFDQFDISKLGTGEGNQAYGHGLYFAGNEKIAKHYRDALSQKQYKMRSTSDEAARKYGSDVVKIFEDSDGHRGELSNTLGRLQNNVTRGLYEAGVDHIDKLDNTFNPLFVEDIKKTKDRAERLASFLRSDDAQLNKGHMYKVKLNVKPEELLDWDQPVSADAPQSVKDAFNNVANSDPVLKEKFYKAYKERQRGSIYYSILSDHAKTGDLAKNQAFASSKLQEAGLKGIRYRDAGSRDLSDGDPTHNYVMFHHDPVQVVDKYEYGGTVGKAGGGEMEGVEGNNRNGVMGNENETAPLNLAPRAQAGGLPNARGIRGSIGVLQAQNEASLEGLPTKVSIPLTGGSVSAGHDPRIRQIARDYMASTGLPYNPPTKYAKVDPKRASRIAAAYDEMADNASDPLTKASYGAMIKETMAQYHAAKNAGFKAEFWNPDTEEDPYKASPRLATEDVRNNHHMWVYPTRSGYGSDGPITAKELEENPLLQDSGETWNGQPATVNDIFRAVHDYYGHAKEGVGFRGDGEENAWRSHASMYSPLARMAMTSETRGQNSWLNYGVHGEKNRNARTEDTVFAPQKVGILPHWAHHEGAEDFMGPEEVNAMAAVRKVHGRASGGSVDAALALTRRFTKDGKAATVALKPKGK